MALRYDFDIFSVVPTELFGDPKVSGILSEIGVQEDARANKVALFRDPATIEALNNAPEALREYFLASGFGMNPSPFQVPWGQYRASDEAARNDVTVRLTENIQKFTLPKVGETPAGGFELADFLRDLTTAQPIPDEEVPQAPPPQAQPTPNALGMAAPSVAPAAPSQPEIPIEEIDPRIPPLPTEPEPQLTPTGALKTPLPTISREELEDKRRRRMAALIVILGIALIGVAFFMMSAN